MSRWIGGARHGIEALEERAFLLTIAWPGRHGASIDNV
jgi:hypothetical protein